MPPRKIPVPPPTGEGDTSIDASMHSTTHSVAAKEKDRDGLGVEDLGLPKTMVQRLAKGMLPANTQIQKDAQTAIWKSATVFVSYLASSANENAQRSNKKTIQPADVMDALKDLEYDSFLPRLHDELEKYNGMQSEKRNTYRKKLREEGKLKASGAALGAEPTPASNGTSTPNSPQGGIPFENPYAPPKVTSTQQPSTPGASAANTSFDNVAVVVPPTVSRSARDGEHVAKKARRSAGHEELDEDEDVDMEDDVEEEELEEEEEDDDEPDEEDDGEPQELQLVEDLIEEMRESGDVDEAIDGEESD